MALVAEADVGSVGVHVLLDERGIAARILRRVALAAARAVDARARNAVAAYQAEFTGRRAAVAELDVQVQLHRRIRGYLATVNARPEQRQHEQDSHGFTVSRVQATCQVPQNGAPGDQ